MKTQLVKIKRQRCYSDDFKRKIVAEYEKGTMSVPELSKFYQIHNQTIYDWIYKFSNYNKKSVQVVEMKESSGKKIKALESRIKELERVVGVKQMNIDFLEKMIELAKEEYDIDIKKNSCTPPLDGLKKTKKK